MSLIFDVREHALLALAPETPAKQLAVGDCWVMNQAETPTPVVIIERKTTADFEASFLDGRYREQRTRLLAYCAEQKAKALYILEGGLDGKHRRMERPALQKLLHRLMLRYGIAVFCTKNLEDTLATVQMLAQQVSADPAVFQGEQLSYTDVQHVTKKANKDDPTVFAVAAIQGCPGISAKGAQAIVDVCGGTLEGILQAEEQAIANCKVGERRIGPAVAKRLYALLHSGKQVSS